MKTRRRKATASLAAALLAAAVVSAPVSAGDAAIQILPSAVRVTQGQTFAVRVEQDAPGATSGVQASIEFNPLVLQIVSVQRGASYADAPVFLPQDLSAAIAIANSTGKLKQVAAAFLPPAKAPAGPRDFLLVSFRAVGCGQTDLQLPVGPADAAMISGAAANYGQPLAVSTSAAHVTTCVSADQVTPAATVLSDSAGGRDGGVPVGLLGTALAIVIALAGGLAWRHRTRRDTDDEFVD